MGSAPDRVDGIPDLLARARNGDQAALDELFAGHVLSLRRWAAGRLPRWARDLSETSDLVQDTVLRTFQKLDDFEYRGTGSLGAYLRGAFMNRLRDEFRRTSRGNEQTSLDPECPDRTAGPDEIAAQRELMDRYENGLHRLSDAERELVVCRLELGMTYQEIATAANRPSSDAARVAVARALVRLAAYLEVS